MTDIRPDVVIVANVEDMIECTERVTYTRDEWEAMTPVERALAMEDFGATTMNNAGGYGVSIESGADDTEVANLPGIVTVINTLASILADIRDFHAAEDGTDKHPDRQYLTEDVERRLTALLGDD